MSDQPRMPFIQNPLGVFMRTVYWVSRKKYGKVIAPVGVIYARRPFLLGVANKMLAILERRISLSNELVLLIQTQAATLNGCSFCQDLKLASVLRTSLGVEKFSSIQDFATSPHFADNEKAVLQYTKEATERTEVSDETYAQLKKFFNDEQIIEITWVNATENYFNKLSRPLGITSDQLASIGSVEKSKLQ